MNFNTNNRLSLKNLNDQVLVQKTEGLVKEEREILTSLLHYFCEIERRRLYCDYKYSSLHKMLVGHFGYSDDEAYRRESAMRLLKEVPEAEEKIVNGELSLSHLSLAQTFFKKEARIHQAEFSKEDKLGLLSNISEQPLREAQRIVLSRSSAPEELRPDRITVITEDKIELRFTAHHSLESKISELKGLLAHKHPSLSLGPLVELLCDMGIETVKKEKTATPRKSSVSHLQPGSRTVQSKSKGELQGETQTQTENPLHNQSKGYAQSQYDHDIPSATPAAQPNSQAQTRREVWQESQHHCTNCGSSYALEIDHLQPKAKGGDNTKANLRILCRACNQRAAIREFGQLKMDLFIN